MPGKNKGNMPNVTYVDSLKDIPENFKKAKVLIPGKTRADQDLRDKLSDEVNSFRMKAYKLRTTYKFPNGATERESYSHPYIDEDTAYDFLGLEKKVPVGNPQPELQFAAEQAADPQPELPFTFAPTQTEEFEQILREAQQAALERDQRSLEIQEESLALLKRIAESHEKAVPLFQKLEKHWRY